LPELLPGLSMAVRTLARAAKNVPEASDIYVRTCGIEWVCVYMRSACRGPAAAAAAAAAAAVTRAWLQHDGRPCH
jgi:hypothetical protein